MVFEVSFALQCMGLAPSQNVRLFVIGALESIVVEQAVRTSINSPFNSITNGNRSMSCLNLSFEICKLLFCFSSIDHLSFVQKVKELTSNRQQAADKRKYSLYHCWVVPPVTLLSLATAPMPKSARTNVHDCSIGGSGIDEGQAPA